MCLYAISCNGFSIGTRLSWQSLQSFMRDNLADAYPAAIHAAHANYCKSVLPYLPRALSLTRWHTALGMFLSGQVRVSIAEFRHLHQHSTCPESSLAPTLRICPRSLSSQWPHLDRIPSKADCLVSKCTVICYPQCNPKVVRCLVFKQLTQRDSPLFYFYLQNPAKKSMIINGKRTHEEHTGNLYVLNLFFSFFIFVSLFLKMFSFYRAVLPNPSMFHTYASSLWVKVVSRRRVVPEGEPTQGFRCQFQLFVFAGVFSTAFCHIALLERLQIQH